MPEMNSPTKKPGWTRVVDIIARTGHVTAIGVVFAAVVFNIPSSRIIPWNIAVAATGAILVVSEICHRPHWIQQCRGLMVMAHVALLGLVHVFPDIRMLLLSLAIVFGMVGSHMPKNIRYWFLIHGREMRGS
jgi:hypothetical protein